MHRGRLITDARGQGLGWILVQQTEEDDWRLVWAGSAALQPAQRNYPALHLELLGVVHAMEKCDYYFLGAPRFQLVTDHAPLLDIFKKDLWDISPKLQPLVERAGIYSSVTSHCKGKRNKISDALSRFPFFGPELVSDPWLDGRRPIPARW